MPGYLAEAGTALGEVRRTMSATLVIPAIVATIKIKRKTCEGTPFPNLCTIMTPVGLPPPSKFLKVAKREQTIGELAEEHTRLVGEALQDIVLGAETKRIRTSFMAKNK